MCRMLMLSSFIFSAVMYGIVIGRMLMLSSFIFSAVMYGIVIGRMLMLLLPQKDCLRYYVDFEECG